MFFAWLCELASNTFFLQFPNCLPYESLEECVEKLKWALQHEPIPLTDDHRHRFTWEGATERLFEAGAITKKEMRERITSDAEKADVEVAWFHVDSAIKGKFLTNFFSGLNPLGIDSGEKGDDAKNAVSADKR